VASLAVGCSASAPSEGAPLDASRSGDSDRSKNDAAVHPDAPLPDDDGSGGAHETGIDGESRTPDASDGASDRSPGSDAGGEARMDGSPPAADAPDAAADQGRPGDRYALTVLLSGRGHGRVASNVGAIACGTVCSDLFAAGTIVTLSASPDAGSSFAGWSGDCTGVGPCTVTMSAARSVTARFFRPVLLNDADKSADVVLTPDRLAMQQLTLGRAGVRSDLAIQPGSGVFYFEGRRLVEARFILIGVATASAPLDTEALPATQGFNIDSGDGSWVDPKATSAYGFVVDYRQAHPTVHLIGITASGPRVAFTTTLSGVSEPLYIFLGGLRRNVGPQAAINAGNDTVNFPFAYDPVALMKASSIAGADQLVMGWGDSFAGVFNAPPSLQVSADQTVPPGTAVTMTATANDQEDGDLTATIQWEDRATPLGARVVGTGNRFTFTPDALGLHEVSATVTDRGNKVVTRSVRVTVSGTLPSFNPVRLAPDSTSGSGIALSIDGLGAHFTAPAKMGIRANQGLLHGFQYFEIHREIPPANVGGGLVTGDGNLNPYGPRDVPASCSVNVGGGTWRDLMFSTNFSASEAYYGFAVDYRGASPVVYVIVGGVLADIIAMTDATVPVYPMLYGNPVSSATTPDETINFGAQPFHYDPRAVLKTASIDASALQLGWGPYAR